MPQFQGGGPDQGQARRLARTRRLHASAPDVDLRDTSGVEILRESQIRESRLEILKRVSLLEPFWWIVMKTRDL